MCIRVGLRPTYKSFLCVSTWAYAQPTNLFYVSPRGLKPSLQIFFYVSPRGLKPTLQIFFYMYPRGLTPTLQIFFMCIRVGLRPPYSTIKR